MLKLLSVVLFALCVAAPPPSPVQSVLGGSSDPLLVGKSWVKLVSYDLKWSPIRAPHREYALQGASIGFRVNGPIQGGVIIDTLDRPAVAAFVGWSFPPELISSEPSNDLRAVFIGAEGKAYVSKFAAGGGYNLMFLSPDDVPMESLTRFELYRDAEAAWAKGP